MTKVKQNKKISSLEFSISNLLSNSSLPFLESELLIAFLLKKNREYILSHPKFKINNLTLKKFKILEKKRLANFPLAYLIKKKSFYNLEFMVSPAVLVPRPETELMLEEILKEIKKSKNNKNLLIDLGTGSGAIIISAAHEIKNNFPALFKKTEFWASDLSLAALNIAQKNASKYKLNRKIKYYQGNLLNPLKNNLLKFVLKNKSFRIIIAANLPYLNPLQIKNSPSISREPRSALVAGQDGLKYYKELFLEIQKILKSNPEIKTKKISIFCEIDPSQNKEIKKLATKLLVITHLEIKKDLNNLDRLLILKL